MKKDDLELIDYAIYFATKAHTGQKRKSEPEVDMIFHPFTVGMILQRAGANTNCAIAGILHDVVEDSNITLDDLSKYFDSTIIEALRVLTKKNDDNYEEYIKRVKTNEIATIVKLKDLEHNMDLTRLDEVTEDDIKRNKKYEDAISYLEMVKLI